MSGLTLRGVIAGYGPRAVIDGLDLDDLRPGTVTALVGPNGAGKSTLLRAVAGLTPARGSIRLGDTELTGLSFQARARHVAYMPQAVPEGVALTVLETVMAAYEASPAAGGDAPADEVALQALRRAGAGDLALRRLDQLSGGQRQIAGLAQALVRQPGVLLLDEPTSALDLRHQLEVLELARAYARERQAVVVMVLHDLQAAARVADRLVVLSDGRIAADGAPAAAITSQVLAEVWRVRARVEPCAQGTLQVLVDAVL